MKTLYESLCESLCEDFFDNVGGSPFKLIDDWCKNNIKGKYKIDRKTLTINSPGNITIKNKELTEFPSYVRFGTVEGDFYCTSCTSLKSFGDISTHIKGKIYSGKK